MVFKKGHKGYKNSGMWKKGQVPWNKGIRYVQIEGDNNPAKRPEVRKKISQKLKGRKNHWQEGEKHFNWRGGKSFEEYPKEFFAVRNTIIKRDESQCKKCNEVVKVQAKKLFISVHHIDYDKQNNKENNLITLCNICNSAVNFNRNKWTQFFRNKLVQGVM